MKRADITTKGYRRGGEQLEPRQIISRVKRVFEGVAEGYSEPTAFMYNHFLWSGQLPSLPVENKDFNTKNLSDIIQRRPYPDYTREGELVDLPLAYHLFRTHKTKYTDLNILQFLESLCEAGREVLKKRRKRSEVKE